MRACSTFSSRWIPPLFRKAIIYILIIPPLVLLAWWFFF